MQHIKNLQQQGSDTAEIHKKLITVICAYHSSIHTFTWADTKAKLNSETLLEIIFIYYPRSDLAWIQGFLEKKKLFDEMQTQGEKATNKLKLLKSQRAAHGTSKTWSTFETAYPKSTVTRLWDSWKGHMMHLPPSNKQVFHEKLLSNPFVPSVQKNENEIAITCSKNK